ncbi:oligopeptide ABC transporter permease [Alkalicoccobacillus murimartini]|uniref:ABC-type dipeptide/oligopeptide/nickel transport system permease component n=1 Tax=Alkalicoccobacillus murimartini TaxID=171685 RepID=A0ABT9YGH0_9BACI|nr:oligopeptide ABC transporter permease [Alkalicoccobacillus murimartini]MDQ0206786.1 ABC-type dipeptide/oligopeptide/nickel transport system permease component [Alkalicoccobacillus murimartini]
MWKFILRRLIIAIPQLILLSLFVFLLAQAMPGDALTGLIGDPDLPPEVIQEMRVAMGVDNPWYIQYKDWVLNALQGDFGRSFARKVPVTDLIESRVWNTVWLSLFSTILIYLMGIPLGIISGKYHDTIRDRLITGYTYVGFATPLFIFALIMLLVFGFMLRWFPTGGSVTPGLEPGTLEYVLSKINHLILPSFSIALIGITGTVQYLRSEIVDTKQKDFVRLARSKGVSEKRLYNKHIFRNSLMPVAALFGYEITLLISGSIFVEAIYTYPGMGQLFVQSINTRDFSVVTALVLIFGLAYILGGLLSDIIMSLVDPRIRIK